MLHQTKGIVVRTVKYGDTSLVATLFTEHHGIQAYMVQGVRSSAGGRNRAAFFQPGMLLELIVYRQPQKNMQRIREFQAAYIYDNLQENIIKNSILLFSVELLVKLLPEEAPLPELFAFAFEYFIMLDKLPVSAVANFPLHFLIRCSKFLGYEVQGSYSADAPYLNLEEGYFTSAAPGRLAPFTTDEDSKILGLMLRADRLETLHELNIAPDTRMRLLDWYITYLHNHSDHMGNLRSLPILRSILHG